MDRSGEGKGGLAAARSVGMEMEDHKTCIAPETTRLRADPDLSEASTTATLLYTLVDRREVISYSDVLASGYQVEDQDCSEPDLLSQAEVTDTLTSLQVDVCRAPIEFYAPRRAGLSCKPS